MNALLHFDPDTHQLTGPAGVLSIAPGDDFTRRFLMILEGQCLESNVTAVAEKYGFCRQRYYQVLDAFKEGGLCALQSQKRGPKSNYRRTDQAVRQVMRHRFLDPDASPAVIAQKLRQTHFPISLRSVHRILADFGLQKKTLRTQPEKSGSRSAGSAHAKGAPPRSSRRRQRRAGGSSTSSR